MIEYEKDPNRYIYHYTSASTAIDFILPNQTLRLSPYTSTNDPKETKDWHFDQGAKGDDFDFGKYPLFELASKLSKAIKQKAKVLCFCQDRGPLRGVNIHDIPYRGYFKPRMWAQYGDSHRGVCLILEKKNLQKEFESTFKSSLSIVGPVNYKDTGILLDRTTGNAFTINMDEYVRVGFDEYMWAHIRTYYQELFFQKMTDWSQELELRFLLFSDSSEFEYLSIKSSLVGIVFGTDAKEEDVKAIQKITRGTGIQHIGIIWKNNSPWYDYGNPLFNPALRNWGKA
ncbi:MAG: DUF2971 domain-containing protein [Proteobacteria bacterium]|nr:DUF2971 domain-containing protein [Pseudomonadota bacterium]MBU4298399.1 DUF2971 domain-containing protein [Pseudomonadota bacterium]MCG2746222.1 DUF2971 domain-containing protein [Desulfobulbaceae bacterium]